MMTTGLLRKGGSPRLVLCRFLPLLVQVLVALMMLMMMMTMGGMGLRGVAATHSGDWMEPVQSLPPSVPRVERPIRFPPGVVDVQRKGLNASELSRSPHASIAEEEADPRLRRLHACVSMGEAYSASWLVTAKYLAASRMDTFNLTWVNCEMASFMMVNEFRRVPSSLSRTAGMVVQSLDVLDLAVLHLSTFERSHKRYQVQLWSDKRQRTKLWHNIDPVQRISSKMEAEVRPLVPELPPNSARPTPQQQQEQKVPPTPSRQHGGGGGRGGGGGGGSPRRRSVVGDYSPEAMRTIAIMPFLGGAMGAGHSVLSNRYHYLRACFWSLYAHIPSVAVGVTQASDVVWARNQSGMPWHSVFLFENLPKSASLPVRTVQHAQRMIVTGQWAEFDYVFYTESDQILLLRDISYFYNYLNLFPYRVIVPHRLMVYPDRVLTQIHKRMDSKAPGEVDVVATPAPAAAAKGGSSNDRGLRGTWDGLSCCLPRKQNCVSRDSWVPVSSPALPVLNYSGIYVPLGNSNFLLESYHACKMVPFDADRAAADPEYSPCP